MISRPWRRTGITKICQCGQSFYCEKSKINRKKYCSVKCRCRFHPKGAKYNAQSRLKISLAKRGIKFSESHKKNIGEALRGRVNSKESNEKNRLSQIKRYDRIGRKPISELQIYNDDAKDRRSSAYSAWRKQVWLRDNFKCKIANSDCNGRIEARHILGWKNYKELRYEVNNGITLCHFHHPRKRVEEAKLSPYFQRLVSETN